MKMERMWINQPSTQQPYHSLHGTNVLAAPEATGTCQIYFLSGETISQQIDQAALSPGWTEAPGHTAGDSARTGDAERIARRIVAGTHTDDSGTFQCPLGSECDQPDHGPDPTYCGRCGNATSEGAPYCGSCEIQRGCDHKRRLDQEEAEQRDPGPTLERIRRNLLDPDGQS